MNKILIALTALTLVFGSAHAASFRTQESTVEMTLAAWHTAPSSTHIAAYASSSLSEVVGGYWQALQALGYQGSVTRTAASSTTYLFESATGTLEATFTFSDAQVIATVRRSETYA
jgi:hypothetical protein